MDLNNLERGGLQNLQNQETDFDQAAMWANLEQPKKKRRPILWFWFGGAAGVFLLSVGLFFYSSEKSNSDILVSQSTDIQLVAIDKDSDLNIEKNENFNAKSAKKNERKTAVSENKIDEIINSKTVKPQLEIADISKTETIVSKTTPSNLKTDYRSKLGNANTPSNLLIQSEVLKNESNSTNQKNNEIYRKVDEELAKIKLSKLPMKFAELNIEIESGFEKFEAKKMAIIPIKKPNFSLSIFAGIGYQFKNLESKNNEPNSELLATRNATESLLESLAFGFDIDKNIGKKWSVGTGVEMILHTEKMMIENRTINNIANLAPSEIPAEYAGREGFLIRVRDSIYYNQHRLINLPLRASYLINLKKVRLLPEAGLVFNISQKSAGHLRNEFAKTEEITTYFKNRIGLSYRFGCKILIPAGRQFSLYAKPSFEWNPNDISSDNNLIFQKRNVIRLDIGVKKSL